jgi:hypothetical protein
LRSVERIRSWRGGALGLGCSLAVLSWSGLAHAQQDDRGGVIAEALFRAGRELMASGDYAQACPKFAESQRLDPKPGTLVNLALCHEKSGRTASAWSEYLQAAELARRAGQSEREGVARSRARALEPALAHIVIQQSPTPGAQVTLDGQAIGEGAFGTPIPVDFGEHVVRAGAAGKKLRTLPVVVSTSAEQQTLQIPALEDEDPPRPASPVVAPPAAVTETRDVDRGATPRTWGFVTAGAGIALLGVGTYFGVRAFASKSTAENECDHTYCTRAGLDAIDSMKTAEAVSTISIAAGLAATGAGVYLVLSNMPRKSPSSPPRPSATLRVTPDPSIGGARMIVTW